jgi:UDP-3-O-[3-hydroxymyristoyl] glucosamine N-acyltransferase
MRRLETPVTLAEIASWLGGAVVHGDSAVRIDRIAPLDRAVSSDLSFLSAPRHAVDAAASQAGAFLCSEVLATHLPPPAHWIETPDPYLAYARVARCLAQRLQPPRQACIDPSAILAEGVVLGPTVRVGPQAVIGAGARLGAGTVIGAGCVIGERAVIGAGSLLHPRVSVLDDCEIGEHCVIHSGTVIGSDGFGFAKGPQGWEKIPQLGRVLIGDDVEIGANCAIDRGALEDTVIGTGCKLDNLIQVAHNVQIGAATAIAACVGIAGSARIGAHCMIGGGAGILGHLEICDRVTISAMSLVTRSIRKPGFYSGVFPLMDNAEWERAGAIIRKLPDWRTRWRTLEARFKDLP